MPIFRIPARADARDADFGVASAGPVDRHDHLLRIILLIDDDFLNQDAREPLLRALSGSRSIPRRWQIVGQCQ